MWTLVSDETEAEREQKRLDRAKRRALSSSVIRELKEQYSDAPEEIRDSRHPHVTRQSQEDQHRSELSSWGFFQVWHRSTALHRKWSESLWWWLKIDEFEAQIRAGGKAGFVLIIKIVSFPAACLGSSKCHIEKNMFILTVGL